MSHESVEKITFAAGTRMGDAVHAWWRGLASDRASRAELRRCHDLDAVVLSEAYQRFYRYLLACGWTESKDESRRDGQREALAAIAALLAHVEADCEQRLPAVMSEKDGDRNRVSELRFRDLLKSSDLNDLFVGLRRVLPLIGRRAGIHLLARDVYYWQSRAGNIPKEWAYAYQWEPKVAPASVSTHH